MAYSNQEAGVKLLKKVFNTNYCFRNCEKNRTSHMKFKKYYNAQNNLILKLTSSSGASESTSDESDGFILV